MASQICMSLLAKSLQYFTWGCPQRDDRCLIIPERHRSSSDYRRSKFGQQKGFWLKKRKVSFSFVICMRDIMIYLHNSQYVVQSTVYTHSTIPRPIYTTHNTQANIHHPQYSDQYTQPTILRPIYTTHNTWPRMPTCWNMNNKDRSDIFKLLHILCNYQIS